MIDYRVYTIRSSTLEEASFELLQEIFCLQIPELGILPIPLHQTDMVSGFYYVSLVYIPATQS